jgi:hypothetical protein
MDRVIAFWGAWRVYLIVGAVVAVAAGVLWWRAALIDEGIERGKAEIRATELALCRGEYADLQKAAALQSAAVAVLGREAKEAQAKASAGQAVAQQKHAVAERKVIQIVGAPASSCGAAARQVWGMIQ